jgi:hypothetical protein
MGKKFKLINLSPVKILERKEEPERVYNYLIEFSNEEKYWILQRNIKDERTKKLIKEYNKIYPKIERRGRKKKNKDIEKENKEENKEEIENKN